MCFGLFLSHEDEAGKLTEDEETLGADSPHPKTLQAGDATPEHGESASSVDQAPKVNIFFLRLH